MAAAERDYMRREPVNRIRAYDPDPGGSRPTDDPPDITSVANTLLLRFEKALQDDDHEELNLIAGLVNVLATLQMIYLREVP